VPTLDLALRLRVIPSYDWTTGEASVPINLTASKVTKIGNQLVSIGGGIRYWAESPTNGAV